MRSLRCLCLFCSVMLLAPIVRAEAPAVGDGAEVNLLAMGDWGADSQAQRDVAAAMVRYVHDGQKRIDAMLLVGDNFYMKLPGGVDDPMWQRAFEQMYDAKELNFPFFAVLGNHDYQDGKDAIEFEYAKIHPESRWKLPARWYRVDFPVERPLVSVLMLDSDRDAMGKEKWEQQRAWLAAELEKPRGTWTICCAHHPLFSNGGHGDNSVLQNEWGRLFVKYNVDFYVCGHDHDLQHLQIPNWFTSFVLVGGGGADTKLMRHDDRGPMSRLTHGFGHFDFTAGKVTVSYVNNLEKTIYEFSRDKDGTVKVILGGGEDRAAVNPLRALEGFGAYHPPTSQPATQSAPASGD